MEKRFVTNSTRRSGDLSRRPPVKKLVLLAVLLTGLPWLVRAEVLTVSLDGQWQVADSVAADAPPGEFTHTAPVPGLANLARPAFPDVDRFDSMEALARSVRQKELPESARVQTAGVPGQTRNYFWYRQTFRAPAHFSVAELRVNKAQFGTAVWLNGIKLGENAACFSSSNFDLHDAIRPGGENELILRIGAHPAVLPVTFPAGTDFEKHKWTPGIYDSVTVHFSDNPVVTSVQVAPHLEASEIVVQTRLKNWGAAVTTELTQTVTPWKGSAIVARATTGAITLAVGEERVITQTIPLPGVRLWSPDDPYLYVVETATSGDHQRTRFGMREFRGDAKTGIFYLNGKPCYLRGSNIALHRFFEDPACGNLPWNEDWLHRLLVVLPRQMHWNSFRFTIGAVPDRWLEICDEAGLLIQNEFPIWTGAPNWDPGYARHWDAPELIRQFGDWMGDNWNHPSVVLWDASNESKEPMLADRIVPAVRDFDLSHRPWENSYNHPGQPDDPVESHPYLLQNNANSDPVDFHFTDLETMAGRPQDAKPTAWYIPTEPHPILINEYEWTWLNRDGSPTELTKRYYAKFLPNASARERFAWNAYVLAAETEFWRAHRHHAGVLYFVYLTCSYPGAFTSDNFLDIKKLKLEPQFADYVGESYKPLGVYLNFFQPALAAGRRHDFTVLLINDKDRAVTGQLEFSLATESGRLLARTRQPFQMAAFGDTTSVVPFTPLTGVTGKCILQAIAIPDGRGWEAPTRSRRWVTVGAGAK